MKPIQTAAAIICTAGLALLEAACGAGSPTTAGTTTQTGLVAYARCMRAHGVPNFPDPTSSQGIPKNELPTGSPQFGVASNACQHLAPNGLGPQQTAKSTSTQVADGLAFARCMRAHGFPSFPDPTTQGQLTPQMVTAAGIDLHQPRALRAGLACVPASHGLLKPVAIERAVNGG
ncbi:MAG: hypothetical protein ACLP01_28620 [Solirubrobacteraceae bacterium]